MKLASIKKAVNEKITNIYPDIRLYGKEVSQGYITPCFFTSLVSQPITNANKHFIQGGVNVKILYFQDVKDEADQLTKMDEIFEAFGKKIEIDGRVLEIKEKEFDYVGEKSDILEMTLKIPYMENQFEEDETEKATDYKLSIGG